MIRKGSPNRNLSEDQLFSAEKRAPRDRTVPNIRLVKSSPVVELTRAKAASFHLQSEPPKLRWLPYLFGALMAFGFVYIQKSNALKTAVPGFRAEVSKATGSGSAVLELARGLGVKKVSSRRK